MSFKIFDTSYKKNVIKSDCGDCIENFKTSLVDSITRTEHFAMGTINNYPCIVYNKTNDDDTNQLFFRQYKKNSWTEPIMLDNNTDNWFTNVVIINLPDNTIGIFYTSSDEPFIFYIKSNINGSSFEKPLNTLIFTGNYFSSLLVNGKPSIFYVDNNINLLFTRNGNLDCNGPWTEPIRINEINEPLSDNYYFSSYIINKNPSIVYNTSDGDLRYIRSDDNEGNKWTKINKLKLKTNGDCSLNVINEKPIIAFSPLKNLDTNISVLSVIISNDINGGIWNDPPIILDSGNLKQNNSSEKVEKISMNIITNRCYITYRYVNHNVTNIRSILVNITRSKQNIPQIIYANSPNMTAMSRIVNKKFIVAVADTSNFFLYYLTRDIQ